jgi:hypothetical protein
MKSRAVFWVTLSSAMCASSTLARPRGLEGSFVGWYELNGLRHNVATLWHTRDDGMRVTATALGSQDGLVFHEGVVAGLAVEIEADTRGPAGSEPALIEARIAGPFLRGTIRSASSGGRLVLSRAARPIIERGFAAAETDSTGTPTRSIKLAAAVNDLGELLAGRFTSEDPRDCSVFGCSGEVMTLTEAGTSLTMTLRSDGPCLRATSISATFDTATRLYSGAFTTTGCGVAASGPLLAARAVGTRSEHAGRFLAALARLADDLERAAPMPRPHPSFLPGFLYSGRSFGDLMDEYDAERAVYSSRRVTFERLHSIRTIVDPLIFPGLEIPPFGAEFDEHREGLPVAGGPVEAYVDSRTRPGPPRLLLWAEGPAGWSIAGNGSSGIDLPFVYTPNPNGTLEVTAPGGTIWVSVGPYGAHTGHVNGDAKTNLMGFFSDGYREMVDLGDGDGVRDPGEPWGFYGGPDGALIRNRIPTYTAPADAQLESIVYEAPPAPFYFDALGQWGVRLRFADGTALHLGHLGRVAPLLRARVLAALGIDVWSYAGPPAVVVPPGSGIMISAGEELAQPQVIATQYPPPFPPGYYTGSGAGAGVPVPWAQMEFAMFGPVWPPRQADVCIYEFMPRHKHVTLQQILDAEIANPESLRFERVRPQIWLWAAEQRACNAYSTLPDDFSSLDTRLGGWFEQAAPSSDEIVSFVRIARDTRSYNPALYDPRNIGQLVRRMHAFAAPFSWVMPDGTTARPFMPAGEVLDRTASTLLIKWRDLVYPRTGGVAYQWASYRLRDTGLIVRWGPFLDAPAAGGPPVLTDSTPCNGLEVVCYDHVAKPGY